MLNPASMPPLWQPVMFLLLAPLMLLLAMVVGFLGAGLTTSGWPHAGRAMLHLVTLGVFASALLGATFQVYPVVLGQPVRFSRWLMWPLWLLWPLAVFLLALFFLTGQPAMRTGAVLLLGSCIASMVLATWPASLQSWRKLPQWGLRLVWFMLVVMVLTGQNLAGFGRAFPASALEHGVFGLGILVSWVVMSMALHVLPMFYVHRPPDRWFVLLWHLLQVMAGIGIWFHRGFVFVVLVNQVLGAGYLLWFLAQGRRRPDATVRYWQLALLMQLATAVLAGMKLTGNLDLPWRTLIALHMGGFVVTLIMGMSQRIVSFLSSLHSGRLTGASSLSMGQLLAQKEQWSVLKWHMAALLALVISIKHLQFLQPVYVFEGVAAVLWLLNLLRTVLRLGRKALGGQPA
jgi:hypothetical protein